MHVGAVCGLWVWVAVKNSIGIVMVGMFSCVQLVVAAWGCGLQFAFIFGQGSNFAASYCKQHRTYILLIFKII